MKTIDFLQALSDESVEFVLVGGMAVQLHGYLRMTYDIDLVLGMSDANVGRQRSRCTRPAGVILRGRRWPPRRCEAGFSAMP